MMSDEDRQTDPPAVGFHSTKYCTRKKREKPEIYIDGSIQKEKIITNWGKISEKQKKYLKLNFFRKYRSIL
jgi:hypothetical protein